MGILRGAISSAMGGNDVKNGFSGPQMPSFGNQRQPYSQPDQQMSYFSSTARTRSSLISHPTSPHMDLENYSSWVQSQHTGYDQRVNEQWISVQDSQAQKPRYSMSQQYSSQDPPPYEFVEEARIPQIHDTPGQGVRSLSSYENARAFRPLALPQTTYGDGQPFLRGYSHVLSESGISESIFIGIVDAINIAIVPNPEMQMFQQGANIAGWFLPGAASTGLMVGQIVVGAGGAFGHIAGVNKVLARANLDVFVPKGLEICIGSSKNVDQEVGFLSQTLSNATPQERLAAYGNRLAPLDIVLSQVQGNGRNDPMAKLGQGLAKRAQRKKTLKAQKTFNEGKSKKLDRIEGGLKWLIVRQASEKATTEWQKVLQQSQQDISQEHTQR